MISEKRLHVRQRTFLGATVEFTSRSSTMNCMVRNISAGGAMIACHNSAALPGLITLAVPQKGGRWQARVVWRQLDTAGVAFVNAA